MGPQVVPQPEMTLAMTLLIHLVKALMAATIPLVTLLVMLMETMALAIPETSQPEMTLAMTLLMHLVLAVTAATIPLVTLLEMLMETMALAIPETSQSPMAVTMTPRLMTLATTKKARLRSTPPLWKSRLSPGQLLTEITSGMTTASAVTPATHQTEQSHSLRFRLSTKNSVLRA